jgi:hypothetical protein
MMETPGMQSIPEDFDEDFVHGSCAIVTQYLK